ncbi:hypothetical protein Tco_1034574 [Tanacetum coccineum]
MGLLDFIKTADPRKVRAVEVQKGDDQVTLLESTRHCFMPLVIPAAGGSGSVTATEIPALTERGHESVAEEDAYLELADPGEGTAMVRQSDEEVVTEQPKKIKKKRLTKQSDVLPAKKLRTDHPSLASGTGGKSLAGLEQIMPAGSRLLAQEQSATLSVAPPQESESFVDLSAQASLQIRTTVGSGQSRSLVRQGSVITVCTDACAFRRRKYPMVRILFTNFFMAVLKYFRVHISQLSPFGEARVSHFEVLTRVLDLSPSVTVFRAFYTCTFSDGLFSFAKRSTSALSCFPKPPDSIKIRRTTFFWVDSCVFPISVPLYTGGVLEKDLAPYLTARQEQTVKLLESHKAPFRRYPECFLCLVGLSPYYPFDNNSYSAFERPNRTDMGLLDFIKTADPRKVRAVEVQKGDDQGSGSVAATKIHAPTERGQESVAEEDAYLELADPGEGTAMVRQSDEEVVTEQPKKIKKKRLTKQSDVLPAKKLRTDHPSLASGTGGKTLAGLEQIMPAGSRLLAREQSATPSVAPPQESESFVDLSAQASLQIRTTVGSSSTLSAPVDTAAATTTSTKAKLAADVNPDLAGPSQLEESEGSDDSFYELATLDPSEAKRWYVPRWNITNDSLLDDGFSCRTLVDRVAPPAFFSALRSMDCDQLYTEFNVGAARQICLGSEVRSRAEHELELKEKLNAKYAARGKLLEKKDSEILRLKSQLAEKEAETAEVVRLRDQVSSLSGEKSALTAEVSALKVTITQKDHDISLLDSRATHLESALAKDYT